MIDIKRSNDMDEATLLAALKRKWAYEGKDDDISHEIYHNDAVLEFPQSQERFVGKQNFLSWRKQYPASTKSRSGGSGVKGISGLPRFLSAMTADPGTMVAASWNSEATR
jgi:hypothetical protein